MSERLWWFIERAAGAAFGLALFVGLWFGVSTLDLLTYLMAVMAYAAVKQAKEGGAR